MNRRRTLVTVAMLLGMTLAARVAAQAPLPTVASAAVGVTRPAPAAKEARTARRLEKRARRQEARTRRQANGEKKAWLRWLAILAAGGAGVGALFGSAAVGALAAVAAPFVFAFFVLAIPEG